MRRDDPPPRGVGPAVALVWVVLSAGGARADEAAESARAFLDGVESELRLASFRDAFFPHDESVKEFFEALKRDVEPDLVLTHARHDLHQDHRIVCELDVEHVPRPSSARVRGPRSTTATSARRTSSCRVEERVARRKCELLMEHFATQRDKHWFTEDVFLGLMRLRGVESRSPTGYAEGFYGRKVRVGIEAG